MKTTILAMKRHFALLVMLVPVVLYFLLFHYTPMAGLLLAFKDYTIREGFFGSSWNGLETFRRLFCAGDFVQVVRNTVTISMLRLVFGFFSPLLLALLLNEVRCTGYRTAVQSIAALPNYFSWVILGGIYLMLLADQGPVNDMLASCGLPRIGFLTEGNWFIATLISTGIWQSVGYGAIIYLAALAGISPDLYEAADVDGANRLQKVIHITLPYLVPTVVTLFILSLGSILNAGFDQIYNLYNPSVYDVSDIIDTFVLRRIQIMEFSIGTAAGLFKSVVGMFLIVTVNSVARRLSKGEQGVY
ncbi:MAG: ABC transporter permease subunit [Verrucomicrobiota bacterium]